MHIAVHARWARAGGAALWATLVHLHRDNLVHLCFLTIQV